MQTLFIEARYTERFTLPEELVRRLPNIVTLAATVQFLNSFDGIKAQLEQAGKQVKLFKGLHAKYSGQILGCSLNAQEETDAFLYIGTGEFHPTALLKQNKPIFCYNPLSQEFRILAEKDIEKLRNKQRGAMLRYLDAKNIGIIISTKPGQNRMKEAEVLKKKLDEQDKHAYLFIAGTLNLNELENFPFIDCWINTMCPRIGLDDASSLEKALINLDELPV